MTTTHVASRNISANRYETWDLRLGAEERLLLMCARQELAEADGDALRDLLQQPLEWDQAIQKARWHRLSGFLFYHLRGPAHEGLVPLTVMARLKGEYLRTTAQYMYSRSELRGILEALNAKQIPVVVLKGSALVGEVYAEPGIRPMADMDLLVPNERIHEAQAIVTQLGYSPQDDTNSRVEHWAQHQHLPLLAGETHSVAVEVHRHIVRLDSPLAFDIRGFWERARPVALQGVSAHVLAPEDLLLHLCLNFFKDRRYYSLTALGQLCDVAEVIRFYDELDWDAVVQRGTVYGVSGPVACALWLASVLLAAPVPEHVISSLAPSMQEQDLALFARQRVLATKQWIATDLGGREASYGGFSLVRALARRILPARDYMRSHYGTASPIAYFRRLGHAARLLVRSARHPSELNDDLSIDRWLHSLYEDRRPAIMPEAPAVADISGRKV